MAKITDEVRESMLSLCFDAVQRHRQGWPVETGSLPVLLDVYGADGVACALGGLAAIWRGAIDRIAAVIHATSGVIGPMPPVRFGCEEEGLPPFLIIGPDGEEMANPDACGEPDAVWVMRYLTSVARDDFDTVQALVVQAVGNERLLSVIETLLEITAQTVDQAAEAIERGGRP